MDGELPLPVHYQASSCDLLTWLDALPLSHRIRNFDTDLCDGILIAEIIAFFFPEHVDLDLFYSARNLSQRTKNWRLLKCEILPKLGLHAPGTVVHEIIHGDNRVVELFLLYLREKIDERLVETGKKVLLPSVRCPPENVQVDHSSHMMLTPRIPRRKARRATQVIDNAEKDETSTSSRQEDVLKVKEKEIDLLRDKLDRCEDIIKEKDSRIQQLEDILGKFNSFRPPS